MCAHSLARVTTASALRNTSTLSQKLAIESMSSSSVRVRVPADAVADWKTLFANGSSAQIVYSADTDVFVLVQAPSDPDASSSTKASAVPGEINLAPVLATVSAVIVCGLIAVVAILALIQRRYALKAGLLATASPSLLQDQRSERDGEHDTSGQNKPGANVLLSAQATPKRTPHVIYESPREQQSDHEEQVRA